MIENLATEILHELKLQAKRWFILLVIAVILLFASNIAWLIAWNLPDSEVTESYELTGTDDANIVYNEDGDVRIHGEDKDSKNN